MEDSKGQVRPRNMSRRHKGGVEVYLHPSLDFGAGWAWVVNVTHWRLYPRENSLRSYSTRGWASPSRP